MASPLAAAPAARALREPAVVAPGRNTKIRSRVRAQWLVLAVALMVLAGLLVTMGTLGDRFGRRKMLIIGSIGFAAISALAAFAPTAELLIAARALLGFFGAMLMPSTLSLLRSIFRNRDQRRLAIAVWASAFSAGSALGPIVPGVPTRRGTTWCIGKAPMSASG